MLGNVHDYRWPGVISVATSHYKGFSKFVVDRKGLLRAARCRACKAYVDEVDDHSDNRGEIRDDRRNIY